ncbi:MAG: DUF1998 domain-containing protein [Lachnospiraceae bacterium]|nr:DUF1998 domain-containing protein [Lachnospiraceae bacterium]
MKYGSKMKQSNKKVVGKIRKSQLITTFGTGAIADMPDYSVIMASTDYWGDSRVLYEPNLQRLLGMKYFKEPRATESDFPFGNPDLPAFRFPMMNFCSKCKKLMSYKLFGDSDGKKCPECNKELVPSRFISACINGHLEDFPYKWWVHYGNVGECPEADRYDKLTIDFSSSSGGLGSIKIKCTACGKERSMEGCMSKDALKGYRCRGNRPWLGLKKDSYDPEECNAVMRTLQRGASNVYFSVTQSALTIPPWSKAIQVEIESRWTQIKDYLVNKPTDEMLEMFIKALFVDLLAKGLYSANDLKSEIKRRNDETENDDDEFNVYRLFEEEFKALSNEYDDEAEDRFKTVEADVPENFDEYLDGVMLVKRLREVLALKGFRRITPERPAADDERSAGMNDNEFVPLSSAPVDWLPAIEMLGEGIFIRFNEEKVCEWEEKMEWRYEAMKANLGEDNIDNHKFSTRYVMLHTFSHLLIRQLTAQCGYSGSALKERIYSTYPDSDVPMAGVLIYTSSSDSDGSLGGLVRQGQTEDLNNTLLNLLQEATWCSSDPLCIESLQQGYNSLNYAACHACALLPETSCEARNCLLDRVAVVGKMENRDMGYFGKILEE